MAHCAACNALNGRAAATAAHPALERDEIPQEVIAILSDIPFNGAPEYYVCGSCGQSMVRDSDVLTGVETWMKVE